MKKIGLLIALIILTANSILYSQDKDVKTYYAKTYIAVFKDIKTKEHIEDVIMGKNITIYYDEILKNISIYYTSREGNSEKVTLSYITKSKHPITDVPHESEVIMSDKFNNIFYISFDPFKTKSLYQFPKKNETEGMEVFLKITGISTIKNW